MCYLESRDWCRKRRVREVKCLFKVENGFCKCCGELKLLFIIFLLNVFFLVIWIMLNYRNELFLKFENIYSIVKLGSNILGVFFLYM